MMIKVDFQEKRIIRIIGGRGQNYAGLIERFNRKLADSNRLESHLFRNAGYRHFPDRMER